MSSNVICRAIKKKSWRKITRGGLLPPANEVCEGYVFTGVCLSTRGPCLDAQGGACLVAARKGVLGCSQEGACIVVQGACMVAPWGMRGCSGGGGVHGCCWGGMLGI